MVYKVIGVMSGSSLDGLDIVCTSLHESGGTWTFDIHHADCVPFPDDWSLRLRSVTSFSAKDYLLCHTDFGFFIGDMVNRFIEKYQLQYQVALVASHGHTSFHLPAHRMTAQLGDGAAIAAETQLPVVSDLRSLDVAFGGQGAPMVPIGEQLLFAGYDFYLNLGGIANMSAMGETIVASDICPANRVLNLLAQREGVEYDEDGALARSGLADPVLLQELDQLEYYRLPWPKSLANEFGTEEIFPLLQRSGLDTKDLLATYTAHVATQITGAVRMQLGNKPEQEKYSLLCTGGGAFNGFLVETLREKLGALNVELVIPDAPIIKFKEALIMALAGVLRWREEYNFLPSVTGAARASIGGALWNGQEA